MKTKPKAAMQLDVCPRCGRVRLPAGVTIADMQLLQLATTRNKRRSRKARTQSVADKHPEVAAYLLANEQSMTLDQLSIGLREKFGDDLAMSKSSISRFYGRHSG